VSVAVDNSILSESTSISSWFSKAKERTTDDSRRRDHSAPQTDSDPEFGEFCWFWDTLESVSKFFNRFFLQFIQSGFRFCFN
jgi:hypothetical protein